MSAARPSLVALALVLAIAPVTLAAQRGGGRRSRPSGAPSDSAGAEANVRRGPMEEQPFLDVWLAHKSDLELGDAQVRSLSEMKSQLDEKSRPLQGTLDSLRAIKGGVDPTEMRARFAAISATMGQMRDNDVAARQAALAMLTPAQRDKIDHIEEEARKALNRPAGERGRRPQ